MRQEATIPKRLEATRTHRARVPESAHRAQLRHTIGELMHRELDLGFAFCKIAGSTKSEETRLRNLHNARKAYDAVASFIVNKKIGPDVVESVAERLPLLKAELTRLGEVIP